MVNMLNDITFYTDDEITIIYRDQLTEAYGMIEVCGYEYEAGRILEEIDPTAFKCGFNDWTDDVGFEWYAEVNAWAYSKDVEEAQEDLEEET